jgi:hypothetical protein
MTTRHFPDYLDATEARIIAAYIDAALARGWMIRVHDGEEWATPTTMDRAEIERAVAATEETTLTLCNATATIRYGDIWFIHGNGEDVLSDCSDKPELLAFIAEVEKAIADAPVRIKISGRMAGLLS